MILEALHTTLNPVLTAYPLIGDIEAELPFCMFKADAQVLRDKAGIAGYIYIVSIGVIAATISEVNTYTASIITTVEAMTGTVNSTVIEKVMFTDESGPYLSEANPVYMNDLEFKIFTINR